MEWLLLILLVAFVLLLMNASAGAQPTWMHCREMRNRYGTPKPKRRGLHMGGYQPVAHAKSSDKVMPPPRRR